jgi:hypothetical protein
MVSLVDEHKIKQFMRIGWNLIVWFTFNIISGGAAAKAGYEKIVFQEGLGKN